MIKLCHVISPVPNSYTADPTKATLSVETAIDGKEYEAFSSGSMPNEAGSKSRLSRVKNKKLQALVISALLLSTTFDIAQPKRACDLNTKEGLFFVLTNGITLTTAVHTSSHYTADPGLPKHTNFVRKCPPSEPMPVMVWGEGSDRPTDGDQAKS